jgi:predicted amidophosphoribosyltransferase
MLTATLLDLVYPETCFLCGAMRGERPWAARGRAVAGLRFWEEVHLCRDCGGDPRTGVVTGRVGAGHGGCLEVAAPAHTHAALVKLVGGLKYHGLRGLAWPLALRLEDPFFQASACYGQVDALVPVPLHPRRRRARGFNQAEILARLLGAAAGLPVATGVLARRRNTGQQARIVGPEGRRRNLEDSFRACPRSPRERVRGPAGPRLGLVDDLVTSGWTAVAAAAALRSAGWEVPWAVALGLAAKSKNPTPRVDTWKDGF